MTSRPATFACLLVCAMPLAGAVAQSYSGMTPAPVGQAVLEATIVTRALRAIEAGNYDRAERLLADVVYSSRDPRLYYIAGLASAGASHLGNAGRLFKEALALDPGFIEAKAALAVTLDRQGDSSAARHFARKIRAQADRCGATCIDSDRLARAASAVSHIA